MLRAALPNVLDYKHDRRRLSTATSVDRSEKQKMLAGELYDPGDPELHADRRAARAWPFRYNASLGSSVVLLREQLAVVGKGAVIQPPFHCDYGYNIDLGKNVFLNFNCVILDVARVEIGAGTQIGPVAQIYTAYHPRDPAERRTGLGFGRPVTVGRNVWVGGGSIILPGVTIGDDAIIGAGSVVTRNVPAGGTALGNPARVRGVKTPWSLIMRPLSWSSSI
jgi:maltose O-acetyltransferase